ncbi:MAG TPA: hypothetical protein VJM11_02650 [Nevskiaceae bacterium]|nr:hypothetical protein [Nevskiaceae bacterium]
MKRRCALFLLRLRHGLGTLAAGIAFALLATFPAIADDIEIYTNPQSSQLKPPMTIVVLDLNLLAVCDNVITNPNANSTCGYLRNTLTVSNYLNLAGTTMTQARNDIAGLPKATLCALNALLPVPLVNQLLCMTLSLLGLNNLITGLSTNLLNASGTLLSALPSAVQGTLDAVIAAPLKVLADPTQLFSVLHSILNPLINSRVAIVVSHANRSNASGTPVTIGGKSYACSFADLASLPGARRTTAGCSNGAYVLMGFTDLSDPAAVINNLLIPKITGALNPANLLTSLSSVSLAPGALLPPFQGREIYGEIAHYLGGREVYNAPLNRYDGLTALLTRDTAIENGSQYIQPDVACDSVNVLNVQVTNALVDADSDADIAALFPGAVSGGTSTFASVVKDAHDNGFKDAANRTIKLNSYFLIQDNLADVAALTSVGTNVLTYANITGLLGLGASVAEFMNPVLVVDASLETPSQTADLRTPGVVLKDVFFPGFRPADARKPTWTGNLKKLALKQSGSTMSYVDVNGADAIAADGRIDENALTFWTTTGTSLGNKSVDGRLTTLGGAGQQIPGFTYGGGGTPGRSNADGKRTLYYDTYSATNVPSLAALNADDAAVKSALQASLGAASATEAQELLLYARGYDVGTTANSKGVGSGLVGRAWLHGALLHSRPVAVNYGARTGYSAANPDVRVIYGAADGFLRMVANIKPGGAQSGAEKWAFLPRAVMSQQKTLRDDLVAKPFPYGVDGAPTVLLQDRDTTGGVADGKIESSNTHDKAIAYFTLRRGGAGVYALDIVNPDSPSLLWRIGTDGVFNSTGLVAGSAAQFANLALGFSNPQVGRMRIKEGTTETTRSVVIFGGGYNGGRDATNVRLAKDFNRGSDNKVGTDDTKGNALYIVDALTGELLWTARQGTVGYTASSKTYQNPLMVDSIASDTTIVDSDGDGLTDRLYVGDTGGRLWRADFPGTDRANWTATPLASLGRHKTATVAADRRFFHAPDYVPFRDSSGAYDVIVLASGDREDPFNYTTANYVYAFKDRDIFSGKLAAEIVTAESNLPGDSAFGDLTVTCATATANCSSGTDTTTGWRMKLTGNGEKAMSQPVATSGNVFFTSFVPRDPTTQSCTPQEGSNRLYGVSLRDSSPTVPAMIVDGDTDLRSIDGGVPGLSGQVQTMATSNVAANTKTLEARGKRYYPVFWRERRGDEEVPP